MPLFRGSATTVAKSAIEKSLSQRLTEQFVYQRGYSPSPSEIRSWDRSLLVMATDLLDAGLGAVEMLIEFDLPFTSKRADVVLAGTNKVDGNPVYVFVELKQWSSAEMDPDDSDLVTIPAYLDRQVLHPQAQVEDYVKYASNYLKVLQDNSSKVRGIAYLHNADNSSIQSLRNREETDLGRLFTGQTRGELLTYLQSLFLNESGSKAADLLLSSAVGASTQLMKVAAEEIQSREMFVLLDEQHVAYQLVLNALENSRKSDSKQIVIISGGPGSGKSAIALQLLGELNRRGFTAFHVTGSKSFTSTLRKVAGKGSSSTKELFKYFRDMAKVDRNTVDVLLADEAHRIRETSTNRFTRALDRTGKAQLEELIDCARVPVFLLDENQIVRPDEVGSIRTIKSMAESKGIEFLEVNLDAQFRCGGSQTYENWINSLLGLQGGHPANWGGDERFVVESLSSPREIEDWVKAKSKSGDSSRITAGFCWSWSEPQNGKLVNDIVIEGWAMPWNAKSERALEDAPASNFWATDPAGIGQVGCVYTAQGFEYDWNGVIIGPDLIWRDGKLLTRPENSKDPVIKKKSLSPEDADVLIRNTYKVLLTRGMKGTSIFAMDNALNLEIQRLLQPR